MIFPKLWHLFILGSRLLLGLIFLSSGVAKLIPGSVGLIGPVWLIEKLSAYGLGLYAEFIAASQLVIGGLLLTRRFATLGAIAAVPMLLNILVITISLRWSGTPYVVGLMCLLNAALLAADYHKLKFLLVAEATPLQAVPAPLTYSRLDLTAAGLLAALLALALLVHHLQPVEPLLWRRSAVVLRWALLAVLATQAWLARRSQA